MNKNETVIRILSPVIKFTYSLFTQCFSSIIFRWYPKQYPLAVAWTSLIERNCSNNLTIWFFFLFEINVFETNTRTIFTEWNFLDNFVKTTFFVLFWNKFLNRFFCDIFSDFLWSVFCEVSFGMREFDSENCVRCHFHFDFHPCRRSTKCTVSHKRKTLRRAKSVFEKGHEVDESFSFSILLHIRMKSSLDFENSFSVCTLFSKFKCTHWNVVWIWIYWVSGVENVECCVMSGWMMIIHSFFQLFFVAVFFSSPTKG